jgi:hypothetical protein
LHPFFPSSLTPSTLWLPPLFSTLQSACSSAWLVVWNAMGSKFIFCLLQLSWFWGNNTFNPNLSFSLHSLEAGRIST